MSLRKIVYKNKKRITISGVGTILAIFSLLYGMSNYGVTITASPDIICAGTCISYINVTLDNYSVCFAKTIKGIYSDKTITYELYRMDNATWKPFTFSGSCLTSGTTHQFKLVGHKDPYTTVKWGIGIGFSNLDPIWYSANSTSGTVGGQPIEHRVFWQDSTALKGYIFSFYNGSNTTQTTLTSDLEAGTQTKTATTVWYQTGQKLPTANAQDTSGSNNWTTPANLYTDDGSRTTAISINSKKHWWSGFAMGIPAYTTNLTINTINVTTQGSNNGTGTVTHTVAVSNDSGATRCPTTSSASYTTTTDANKSTLNGLWGCTWTAAQANSIWLWFNATTIPVSRMVRVDVAWINISYNIADLEANGSDVYYNDSALTVYPQIINISVIVNISAYNNSGSAARSNNNPQLHVRAYNGTKFINIGFIKPTGTGNYTVYTTDSAVLTAWATLTNRDIIIDAEYVDYVNAGQYDTIEWNSIWIQPTSKAELINDSWVPFTGTANWSNVTKWVNATVGSTIKWQVYANNSAGVWNVTPVFSYLTTQASVPCGTVINTAGVYNMNSTIAQTGSGNCIYINTSDVWFDCNGYRIWGDGGGSGIYIDVPQNGSDVYNVTIQNCSIDHFNYGIFFNGQEGPEQKMYGGKILNVTLSYNTYAISLLQCFNATIANIISQHNSEGLYLDGVHGVSTIENISIYDSITGAAGIGLFLYSDGDYMGAVTVKNVYIDLSKIGVDWFGSNVTWNNITIVNSSDIGYESSNVNTNSNYLEKMTIINSTNIGIWHQGGDNNTYTNITISDCAYGIKLSSQNTPGFPVYDTEFNTFNGSHISCDSTNVWIVHGTGTWVRYNSLYNNIFDTAFSQLDLDTQDDINYWNVTKRAGTNIYNPNNHYVAGNYWAFYSNVCPDVDEDGFCDDYALDIATEGNCTAGSCPNNTDWMPISEQFKSPLSWSQNSTNGTTAGTQIEHRAFWNTTASSLSGYIFSFCNGTWNGTDCVAPQTVTLNATLLVDVVGYDSDGGGSSIFDSQLKFDVSQIPVNATIKSATLYLYIYAKMGTMDNNLIIWRINNQTWGGAIDAAQYTALSRTNEDSSKTLSSTTASTWTTIDVKDFIQVDKVAGNKNATVRIADLDGYLITGWTYVSDGIGLEISPTQSIGYFNFEDKENTWVTGNTPYLYVTYEVGWINDSWVPFTGTGNWSNVSKWVNATVGANIAWRVYANNSDGTWNVTSIFNYITTSEGGPSSCDCPGSGINWAVDMTLNCVLSATCNLGTGNLTFTGSGNFYVNALLNCYSMGNLASGQTVWMQSGGFINTTK